MKYLFRRAPLAGVNDHHLVTQGVDVSKMEQEQIARAFTRTFASDDGRIVLSHLQALTFQRAFAASAPESDLRYAEGQRALVAQILRLIDRGRG